MFSYTCKTALKAVIYLATKAELSKKSSLKEIAEHIEASEHTVGKFLQTLVKHRVINSVKGPSGGFYLNEEQRRQPIIRIVEAIDGNQVFHQCGLGLSKCSSTHPCPIHYQFKESRDIIESLCNSKTVSDLCVPVSEGIAYLVN